MDRSSLPTSVRFGPFEADLAAREVRKHGIRLKLQQQPFDVLAALLERPGQLVSRDELRQLLWPDGEFVDYDRGLNKAVNRLRQVLEDDASQPRFIETIPQHGYRFIALIESGFAPAAEPQARIQSTPNTVPASLRTDRRRPYLVVAALAVATATGFYLWRSSSSTPIRSIAVLPLQNLSADPAQEFFSDGLTDELIGELAHISSLHVISRTSVMRYKSGARKSLPEIARELQADAIVEGTVAQAEGKVRISAQLIRARDDRHLWSQKYERDLSGVLALQGDLARAIAWEIRASLTPQERTLLSQPRAINPDAYQAVLQGNYFLHQNIRGVPKSMEWFRHAIELDHTDPDAHAGLAQTLVYAGIYEFRPFAEAFTEARAAAQKALDLQETNAAAHNVLADIKKGLDWDLRGAQEEHRRALQLSPSHLLTRLWYADTLSRLERHDEALAESSRAIALDPVSALSHNNRAMLLWRARRFEEAIREAQIALDLDPSHVNALWWQGLAYAHKRDFQNALAVLRRGADMSGAPVLLSSLGYALALSGERPKALDIVGQLQQLASRRTVSPTNFAVIYAGLGEADAAFQWLEKAYQLRDGRVHQLVWPYFDPFRADPRYQDLKERIGLRTF